MKLQSKDQTLLEQAYTSIKEGGMPPTAGAASHAGSNPGVHNSKGEPLSAEEMKKAIGILEDYSAGALSALEAAELFKALYDSRSAGM